MTRDELIALIATPEPLRAAELAGAAPGGRVTYSRARAPGHWLVEIDDERPVAAHREAHAAGIPSEAVVRYGAGTDPAHTVDRLLALGALAEDTGLLRAVCPIPGEGDTSRPGSWGVEDLVVIGVARYLLPPSVAVRPDWVHLGPAAAQIAVAFGADDWQIPAADATDATWLAGAIGRTAVAR